MNLMDRLPFPLAYPWRLSLDPGLAPVKRVNNMIFTAYQVMRFTGLLFFSDYLAFRESCAALGRPISMMRRPHWSEWRTLTDSLAKYLVGKKKHCSPPERSLFRPLAEDWISLRKAWEEAPRSGLFQESGANPTPMGLFQDLRNDRSHRQGVQVVEDDEETAILERYSPVLAFILEHLFSRREIRLYRAPLSGTKEADAFAAVLDDELAEEISLISLEGVCAGFQFRLETVPLEDDLRDALRESAAVVMVNGDAMPLFPFFLALDAEIPARGDFLDPFETRLEPLPSDREPILLADEFSEKRICYLGVRLYGIGPAMGPLVVDLLSAKQHELGLGREEANRWLMVDWARDNAAFILNGRGALPALSCAYVERTADRKLAATTEIPHKAVLATGEAGVGKSAMIHRLVHRLIGPAWPGEEAGDVVIFLSGHEGIACESGETMERAFCRALLKSCGVKENAFNAPLDFIRRLDENATAPETSGKRDDHPDRRVWIVIDGIDEMGRFRDLARCLDRFVRQTRTFPWLRIVCTMRTGALISLREADRDANLPGPLPFSDEDGYHVFSNLYPSGAREETWLCLTPFSETELKAAWDARQAHLPDRASQTRYEDLPPRIRELLAVPAYHHLFHETWKGRHAPVNVLTERNLLDAHIEALGKRSPGIRDVLRAIGAHFYEAETSFWPEAAAWRVHEAWLEKNRYEAAAYAAGLSPLETLVSESLLGGPTDERKAYVARHRAICQNLIEGRMEREWRSLHSRINPEEEGEQAADEKEAALRCFNKWLAKGERFDPIAAAAGSLLSRWLSTEEVRFLPVLPSVPGGCDRALGRIVRTILLTACASGTFPPRLRRMMENGFHSVDYHGIFMEASISAHVAASDRGHGRGALDMWKMILNVLEGLRSGEGESVAGSAAMMRGSNFAGYLCLQLGESDQAEQFFKNALVLADSEPAPRANALEAVKRNAALWNGLGSARHAAGRYREALGGFSVALSLLETAAADAPDDAEATQSLGATVNNVGRIHYILGDCEAALAHFHRAFTISKSLAASHPRNASNRRDLALRHQALGDLFLEIGSPEAAREQHNCALAILQSLAATEPGRTDLLLLQSMVLTSIGKTFNPKDPSAAIDHHQKALEIRRHLTEWEPERRDFRSFLAESLNLVGEGQALAGRSAEAMDHFETALAVRRKLVEAEPHRVDFLHDLLKTWNRMGGARLDSGAPEAARECHKAALALSDRLLAASPGQAAFHVSRIETLLCLIRLTSGKARRNFLEQARNCLSPLEKLSETNNLPDQIRRALTLLLKAEDETE